MLMTKEQQEVLCVVLMTTAAVLSVGVIWWFALTATKDAEAAADADSNSDD